MPSAIDADPVPRAGAQYRGQIGPAPGDGCISGQHACDRIRDTTKCGELRDVDLRDRRRQAYVQRVANGRPQRAVVGSAEKVESERLERDAVVVEEQVG